MGEREIKRVKREDNRYFPLWISRMERYDECLPPAFSSLSANGQGKPPLSGSRSRHPEFSIQRLHNEYLKPNLSMSYLSYNPPYSPSPNTTLPETPPLGALLIHPHPKTSMAFMFYHCLVPLLGKNMVEV